MNLEVQNKLLPNIKSNISDGISFVDELADVLNISRDSAYRRIRGETLLNIVEIETLTKHYNLSLDSIIHSNRNKYSFDSKSIDLKNFTITNYLTSIVENLSLLSHFEHYKIIYSGRDIPIFHYFAVPEIGKFKIFCWLKTYLNDPELKHRNFDLDNLPDSVEEAYQVGNKVWHKYLHLPSTEIWTSETVIITLKQFNYYLDAGLFATPFLSDFLMEKFIDLLLHIQKEVELGSKFNLNSTALHEGASYDLYYNEVAQGDNSVLFHLGEKKIAFITYCTLNYLSTSNEHVCNIIDNYFNNLIKTSLLLSRTSEKQRNKFFNILINMVKTYPNKL